MHFDGNVWKINHSNGPMNGNDVRSKECESKRKCVCENSKPDSIEWRKMAEKMSPGYTQQFSINEN